MKTLIKSTNILTMVDDKIKTGNILIEDNKISYIGDEADFEVDKTIEASKYLTMPGLINAHTHVAMSLFRNYGNDTDLMAWLNDYIFPIEERLDEEIVYHASILSFAEMIKTGTTSFADMYFFEEATIKALEKAKLRAHIYRGLSAPDPDFYRIRENIDLFEKYDGKDNKITIGLGPHAIYTSNKDYLRKIADIASEYQMPIHIHLSETQIENEDCIKKYGQTPTEVFEECGIFDHPTIAAHGVYLTDNDLEILKAKNVSIIHNPSSNLKLSSGILDISRLIDRGINVCLGTDSAASNNKQSMIKEIELAALLAKYKSIDKVKAFDILKMATINGAKALGIDQDLGSIETGKKADLIMIDIDNINHIPATDLISSLCYSTYDKDVKYVFIDGHMVLDNGKLVYLDEEEIKVNARRLAERLYDRN